MSLFIKKIFDYMLAIILLILMILPMVIIAFLIRIKLGSPIFFIQQRPGKAGRIFKMIKFRTMSDLKDVSGKLLEDDQRMTKFGLFLRKTSLDELPELVNVLKGEMSLVGPRPLLIEYLPLYNEFQSRRHEVKPGITGWAQINGRNAISWEEKFKLDVWYVENRSMMLDLKILILTVIKVISRSGVSAQGQATVENFKGNDIL